ncbi:dipeptidase PepV [Ectobacillus sp. sgz5001026]|uniref:dipeptidase PepV n=1 Tax=Ectobacillus sp. sgz5001026 TaxID=3242473 RepID=UPI0036D31135
MKINWIEEVEKRKDALLADTQQFLRIKSVLDEEDSQEGAPFGRGIGQALTYMLQTGSKDGFRMKNLEGYAGHLEMGQGDELLGILCHVDVVPEGDGWASDPYAANIRDGKIIARGAIDDKGPTMAAYYAMKIVKELGLPLTKRVRMILGADEESHWRCVDHYFTHEEMPTMGFAPDADFPIINAEKGICDAYVKLTASEKREAMALISFSSGRRLNMVPDFATAQVRTSDVHSIERFKIFLQQTKLEGQASTEDGIVSFEVKGISAHGSTPEQGRNAGILLATFLNGEQLDWAGTSFVAFVTKYFEKDTLGKELGISYSDDITGELTVNVGLLNYSEQEGGTLGLNIRYPVTTDAVKMLKTLEIVAGENGFSLGEVSDSKPHHVDKDHVLIQTLARVYEEQTGEKASLLAIGGGTYARSLQAGVAFGPLFPGKEELAHQKDEYIEIDDLVKATAIYAQAIYELAK